MSNKPTNRVFSDKPQDAAAQAKPAKGMPGIEFEPAKAASFGPAMAFALMSDGEKLVLRTPFGDVKISVATSEELAELGEELGKIFSTGLNKDSLQKLAALIEGLPPLQDLLKQVPQLQELLEQAMAAFANMQQSAPQPTSPAKAASGPATKPVFKPRGLTFERLYNSQFMN